jgi:hypothetical protein
VFKKIGLQFCDEIFHGTACSETRLNIAVSQGVRENQSYHQERKEIKCR